MPFCFTLGRKNKRQTPGANARRRRPALEILESRTLLSGVASWIYQGPSPIVQSGVKVPPDNPSAGAIESVAINPNNTAQMYAAAVNGGIWRTNNASIFDPELMTWTPLTDQLASLATDNIAFSPLDASGNTLFATTGSFSSFAGRGGVPIGVLRTTDGGATWNAFPLNPSGSEPLGQTVLPTRITTATGQLVLVGALNYRLAANGGLYQSNDGGQTYQRLPVVPGHPEAQVSQLVGDPNNPNVFYAAALGQTFLGGVFRGVYNPANGAISWTAMSNGLNLGTNPPDIQITAQNYGGTTVLFALLTGSPASAYRLDTSGGNTTWTALAAPPRDFAGQGATNSGNAIIADPSNSQLVYIGGYGNYVLFRYNPANGGSWVRIVQSGAKAGTYPHPDVRGLAFERDGTTNVLVVTTDGGVYFLTNPQNASNNAWESFIGSTTTGQALGVTEFHSIAYDSNSHVIVGGSQDNGTDYQQTPNSLVWTIAAWGDGGDVMVDDSTFAGTNQSVRYFSSQNLIEFRRRRYDAVGQAVPGSDLFLIPDGGLPNFVAQFLTPTALDAIAPTADQLAAGQSTRIVIGGQNGVLYEANNAGTAATAAAVAWTLVPTAGGLGNVKAMAYGGRHGGVDNPDVLYVGDDSGRVFVRTTAGGTLSPTATAFPGTDVRAITLDPNDWMNAFVVTGTGVWETTDAGVTWTNVTGNLAGLVPGGLDLQSVTDVRVGAINVVVVGGRGGVFAMLSNNPLAWNPVGAGLPNAEAFGLQYNADDDVLVDGSLGRGAWTLPKASKVLVGSALTQITIFAGAAGTGTLDHLLTATNGTITPADDPGDLPATLSTGALQRVGAGVPISITADNSIGFGDVGTLVLPTGSGVTASFNTNTGPIHFANLSNTVLTSGGSLSFAAGTDLTVAQLNAANITLSSPNDIGVGGLTSPGTVAITSKSGAILDADTGETEPANPADDFGNGASVDVTADTLLLSAGAGIGTVSGTGAGPLETQVNNLEALTVTGGIHVTNGVTAPVTLNIVGNGSGLPDGVVATSTTDPGDVQLINNGSIMVVTPNDVIRNEGIGNVSVEAVGATADLRTGGQSQFDAILANGGGDVFVSAGRDVLMGTATGPGAIVSSAGAATVGAGRDLIIDFNSRLAVNSGEEGGGGGDVTATAGRNITLQATGGTTGARVANGGGGNILLTTGVGDVLAVTSGAGGRIAAAGGNVTIEADSLVINDPITAGAGIVTLRQAGTVTRAIDLGMSSAGDLGLTDAELDQITAGVLRIGRTDNAGSITITAAVTTHAGFGTLSLLTGGGIGEAGSGALAVASLAAQAANHIDLSDNSSAVGNLAASSAAGGFYLLDSLALTVGSADGLGGITTNGGNVAINAARIQVNQTINTTGGAGSGFVVTGSNVSPQAPNAVYVASPGSAGAILLNDAADERFVNALYVDFLGRSGVLPELAAWVSALPEIGRSGVVNDIMRSTEALARQVNAYYLRFLGRAAVGDEEMGWVNALQSRALTAEQVIADVLASAEFAGRAAMQFSGDPPDTSFVKALYSLLLNRPADASLAGWVNAVPSLGRAGVANAFESSAEYRGGAVRTFYGDPTLTPFPYQPFLVNLLHRSAPPSASEVSAWVSSGLDLLSIQQDFASSEEFYLNG